MTLGIDLYYGRNLGETKKENSNIPYPYHTHSFLCSHLVYRYKQCASRAISTASLDSNGGWNKISEKKKEKAKLSNKKSISNQNKQGTPIVGIGASAGGLEDITSILQKLELNTDLIFVIVQHLATGQESMLPSILARSTKMPVYAVTNEMQTEPNTVYVIPSGKIMTLDGESLKLIPKGASLKPIDAFFDSIAQQRKTQAIGIVLSGTGTDGTEGLREIKNEGGITIAQDPKTAQYTGMASKRYICRSSGFSAFTRSNRSGAFKNS